MRSEGWEEEVERVVVCTGAVLVGGGVIAVRPGPVLALDTASVAPGGGGGEVLDAVHRVQWREGLAAEVAV